MKNARVPFEIPSAGGTANFTDLRWPKASTLTGRLLADLLQDRPATVGGFAAATDSPRCAQSARDLRVLGWPVLSVRVARHTTDGRLVQHAVYLLDRAVFSTIGRDQVDAFLAEVAA